MTNEEAIEYARVNRLNEKFKSVYATSDGAFYLETCPEKIAAHAEEYYLQFFTIKGTEPKLSKKTKKDAGQ